MLAHAEGLFAAAEWDFAARAAGMRQKRVRRPIAKHRQPPFRSPAAAEPLAPQWADCSDRCARLQPPQRAQNAICPLAEQVDHFLVAAAARRIAALLSGAR